MGIIGHQPSIAAHCKMGEGEREVVIQSLLQQKVGSNPKVMKQYGEHRKKELEAKTKQFKTSNGARPAKGEKEWGQAKPELFLRYAKVSVAAGVK